MTGAAQPYPNKEAPHFGAWFKGVIALLLLIALAWVGMIAFQYFRTGKPISESSGIRELKPLARLVQEQPQFSASIWNVARPLGVAVGPDGTVYTTESAGDRLIKGFDLNGIQKAAFGPGTTSASRNPGYVAIGPSGQVYATDLMIHAIDIYAPNGTHVGQVASPFAEGWQPVALTFDNAGNLYVLDHTDTQHRLVVLDPAGTLIRQFGTMGHGVGEFFYPNGIAVDSQGRVFISDSGNGRVLAYDKSGALLWTIGQGTNAADLAMPRGLVVDNDRNLLLVVDTTDGSVKAYDISGATPKLAFTLGETGLDAAQFRFPNAVALDGKGRIYVADRENSRIAVWRY